MSEKSMQHCETNAMEQTCETQPTQRRYEFAPAVDIIEHNDAFELRADVPGATADQVDIHVERGVLNLRVSVTPASNGRKPLLQEYRVGDYVREFRVGEDIDANGIDAQLDHGVLTVRLPKAQAVLPKKIEVRAGT